MSNKIEISIEDLKADNPSIDYTTMSEADLSVYKEMYAQSLLLEQSTASLVTSIDINTFNTNFLAFFSGSSNLTDQNRYDLTQMWMQVAGGTGCVSVNVTDASGANVLFTIPPLYNTESLQSATDGSVGKVIADYKLAKGRPGPSGEAMVGSMLSFIQNKTDVSTNDPWKSFKIHYGLYDVDEVPTMSSGNIDIFD